jgi:hypothetical protein
MILLMDDVCLSLNLLSDYFSKLLFDVVFDLRFQMKLLGIVDGDSCLR